MSKRMNERMNERTNDDQMMSVFHLLMSFKALEIQAKLNVAKSKVHLYKLIRASEQVALQIFNVIQFL